MKKILTILLILTLIFSCDKQDNSIKILSTQDRIMLEKTAGKEIEGAIDEFLSQMTIQEKVGQMCLSWAWDSYKRTGNELILNDDFKSLISKKHIGATYGIYRADPWTKISPKNGPDPIEGVKIINMLQKYNMENSRLKIPILFGESAEHGKLGKLSMVYPTGLMVGCTFNPDLAYEMYKAMAIETYSTGARVVYSPILDLALDPRWGRVEETFGEDPYLAGLLGQLYVKAFQGDSIDENSILITLKHFVHALPEGGHNAGTASIGQRELRSKFLKPFEMAVKQGAGSVMSSYNTIDGVPCSMSKWLLTDVLRDDWGFNGFVISDAASVIEINGRHGVSDNNEEIAGLAVNAGLDMEMGADVFMEHLIKAVENKFIPMENIDLAVRRILRQKFLLGLFDNPYMDENLAAQNINRKDFRELNRQVAREGIVLLENKNKILPLSRDLNSIAVIGPNANKAGNQLGSYTFMYQRDEDVVTVLEGIKNAVNEKTEVNYARGCGIKDLDKSDFSNAINIARKSDLVVLVIGGSSSGDFDDIKFDPKTGSMISTFEDMTDIDCGEGNDKSDLGLSGVQKELFDELKKTNKPVVVVYINGRPISEPEISEKADALVEAWYCGWEGGNAVADILFGKYNPSGKLSISIPFNASQLPVFYNNLSEPRRHYIDQNSAPLYTFGYGLSYTEFEFTDLQLPETFRKNEDITVSVNVKNTGDMNGDAVVQLYVKDLNSSVVTPVKELKAFKKIFINKGETKNVDLIIPFDELALYNINMKKVVEPGAFEIMIGKSSSEIVLKKRITLMDN